MKAVKKLYKPFEFGLGRKYGTYAESFITWVGTTPNDPALFFSISTFYQRE